MSTPVSRLAKRARNSVPLVPEASKDAKRLATVILEVWAGLRTPQQAAEALSVSLPRYYFPVRTQSTTQQPLKCRIFGSRQCSPSLQ